MSLKISFKRFSKLLYTGRFAALFAILKIYLLLSLIVRLCLLGWSFGTVEWHAIHLIKAFIIGFCFDLSSGLSFLLLYTIYLLLLPKRWIGLLPDRIISYIYVILILFIQYISLLAEFPFWEEFGVRYNFIAVDYLIYTYEVFSNINESYPIPLLILILVLLVAGSIFMLKKRAIFQSTFSKRQGIARRATIAIPLILINIGLLELLANSQAETSDNLTINEIGKNGTFSFFAALRSNELDYKTFYPKISDQSAYHTLKEELLQRNQQYISTKMEDIQRKTSGTQELHPNIILITIESFSADFLREFGSTKELTPTYDKLINKGIFFENLYATGTRTVRGMEALTLCVPPTPGNSIVRRPNNDHIYSIATLLHQRQYHPYFIYGGDGYFDNMNTFFGGQGFDIVDRNRGNLLADKIKSQRFNIPSEEVSFENAWGICDEDLYKQALKYADLNNKQSHPFFQFIMTSSNHRPYSFPEGKIDMPSGSRDAAVKYTDFALGQFLAEAKKKPWFKNTVFVIVADHCASSAGKWEINIDKHHIPALIYNLPIEAHKIERLASQVDVMPTLFGYLGWNYNSEFYGQDINQMPLGEERAFIGNYRTLGVLKHQMFTQIDDCKQIKQFVVSKDRKGLSEVSHRHAEEVQETISYYQTASERFKLGKMKTE